MKRNDRIKCGFIDNRKVHLNFECEEYVYIELALEVGADSICVYAHMYLYRHCFPDQFKAKHSQPRNAY